MTDHARSINHMSRTMQTRASSRSALRGGFSLVELLVVIFVIALIIGIAIPAVGRARTAAKVAATRSTVTQISQAIAQFSTDQRSRLPGYFSQSQMASATNATTRGFSNMQNILLDLTSAVIAPGSAPNPGSAGNLAIAVGPNTNNDDNVWVNSSLVGAAQSGSKNYLSINEKLLVRGKDRTGVAEHSALGDLEDTFGLPILAWARNEASTQTISTAADFAQEQVTAGQPQARYYWAGNAAYLTAGVGVGTVARNQGEASNLSTSVPSAQRVATLMTLLGSVSNPLQVNPAWLPSAGRGEIVLHSAGPDLFYLSGREGKGNANGAQVGTDKLYSLTYEKNFRNGAQLLQPSVDQIAGFDDVVVGAN